MVRVTSSSIWDHAESEIGASSRCRLFIRIFSFEGTDAKGTMLGWLRGDGGFTRGRGRRGPVGGDVVEKGGGRDEIQVSCHRSAEVEDAIVIAGRAADEHVLKHLFDGSRRAAVTDEIGAELAAAGAAEWHVVAKDLDFPAVFFDYSEGIVGGGGFDGVVELDVGHFGAPDNFFLGLGGDAVPGVEIVEIFLDDDVAAAGESGIFVADEDGIGGSVARRVF